MATIEEIMGSGSALNLRTITELKNKSIIVPRWGGKFGLNSEYDPRKHPVNDRAIYPDISHRDGTLEKVTRVTLNFQKLAVKRMSELLCGIPVKRVYHANNDNEKEVAKYLEAILNRNRIDSVNVERTRMLFAGCEMMTLWYAVKQPNNSYGYNSQLKFRCRNFSPMNGDELYPLFDEYGDMVAMSVGYARKVGNKNISYLDAYTADRHVKWSTINGGWSVEEDEPIEVKKIPAIYIWRNEPIWEHTSDSIYEMEWALSRNGNYIRRNSKPLFCVFADEEISYGNEGSEKKEFRSIVQYPKGSTAQYITWEQAVDNLKYHITELRQQFFTQLQLPDWSYESMKSTPMSGESRKQLFIDAQMKVKDESGAWIEFFDREINVIKALMKPSLPQTLHSAVDSLEVENVITPYTISERKDTIEELVAANGNKAIMSQRESIEQFGMSSDVDETLRQINEENQRDIFEPYQ